MNISLILSHYCFFASKRSIEKKLKLKFWQKITKNHENLNNNFFRWNVLMRKSNNGMKSSLYSYSPGSKGLKSTFWAILGNIFEILIFSDHMLKDLLSVLRDIYIYIYIYIYIWGSSESWTPIFAGITEKSKKYIFFQKVPKIFKMMILDGISDYLSDLSDLLT